MDAEVKNSHNQVEGAKRDLDHLKNLEQRYRKENTDIQRRNEDEAAKHYEQSKDLQAVEG